MTKLCHICRQPEDQVGGILCSSGAHASRTIVPSNVTELVAVAPPSRMRLADAEYAIFFDIDGCFHRLGAAKHARDGEILPSSDPLFTWAAPFERIIEPYTNVALLSHSMWRFTMSEGSLFRALPPLMRQRFLTCTQEFDRYDSIVKTASDFGFEKYIIIDDSPGEFPRGLANFVECNSSKGMSCEFAQAHLKHLMLTLFGPPPLKKAA